MERRKVLCKGWIPALYEPGTTEKVPGTGKTETAYQLAKATGRDIMMVDISATKSMWFGESEKVVKQIFTKYYEFANSCKVMPILFLNEADALLSNRKNDLNGNVDKTEHTIQNILLDEMENFKGIMFATTNHTSNLDRAFDRRFLYKIELNNPKPEVSAKIWQSKLSSLIYPTNDLEDSTRHK